MSYYLRFYSEIAQANVTVSEFETLLQAEKAARKELKETDEVKVYESGTNTLMVTVFKIENNQNQ